MPGPGSGGNRRVLTEVSRNILDFLRDNRALSSCLVGSASVSVCSLAGIPLALSIVIAALSSAGSFMALMPPKEPENVDGVRWKDYKLAVTAAREASDKLSEMARVSRRGRHSDLPSLLQRISSDLFKIANAFEQDPRYAERNYSFTSGTLPRLVNLAEQAHALDVARVPLNDSGRKALSDSKESLRRAADGVTETLNGVLDDDVVRLKTANAALSAALSAQGVKQPAP